MQATAMTKSIIRRDRLSRIIDLEGITSSKENAEVLRKLRDNHHHWEDNTLYIDENDDDYDVDDQENVFIIREGDDLAWLGYFIGRNETLDELYIYSLPGNRCINCFLRGVNRNRSLRSFLLNTPRRRDVGLQNLYSFFRENNNLSEIFLHYSNIGRDCARDFALALSQRQVKSLKRIGMAHNNLGDESFADIVQALWAQPQFEELVCSTNNIGRGGCVRLGAMMRERISNLRDLNLPGNVIDDECLKILVPGLCNNKQLEELDISSDKITAAGLRALSPLLQSDSCSLRRLIVRDMTFGDEEAAALVDALKGNTSLERLHLPYAVDEECAITTSYWPAFSKLLCDTSSINNTYLSNHTLTHISDMEGIPHDVIALLEMNASVNSTFNQSREDVVPSVARCKILMSHPDLDMEPLFVHKLKFLPLVMNWFRGSILLRSANVREWKESVPEMQNRELSAVYKFVRGMPQLAIEGFWTNVSNESQGEKQRMRVEKRKLKQMIQNADERIQRSDGNEQCALKRLRREFEVRAFDR
ncbi:hypothetical protein ACHAXM_003293 [Skeletonema potamos]